MVGLMLCHYYLAKCVHYAAVNKEELCTLVTTGWLGVYDAKWAKPLREDNCHVISLVCEIYWPRETDEQNTNRGMDSWSSRTVQMGGERRVWMREDEGIRQRTCMFNP